GSLNGLVTVGAFKADQAQQTEREILFIAHVNVKASLNYTGDDQNGSATLLLQASDTESYVAEKTYAGNAHITYSVGVSPTTGINACQIIKLANLDLIADAGVLDPANLNHQLAQNGLDIVQASLIESEPTFEQQASGELFPSLPPATSELV